MMIGRIVERCLHVVVGSSLWRPPPPAPAHVGGHKHKRRNRRKMALQERFGIKSSCCLKSRCLRQPLKCSCAPGGGIQRRESAPLIPEAPRRKQALDGSIRGACTTPDLKMSVTGPGILLISCSHVSQLNFDQ